MNFDVLVFGPIFCDLIFTDLPSMPVIGQEIYAGDLTVTIGGSAIVAAGLHRLGVKVGLIADLGNDPLSEVMDQLLAKAGLDRTLIRKHNHPLPQLTVALSSPKDRAFITRLKKPDPPVDLYSIVKQHPARHIHICSFQAALDVPNACQIAHSVGMSISMDPGWDEKALLDQRLLEMVKDLDVFMPSQNEICFMVQTSDVDTAANSVLTTMENGMVVVKKGKEGAKVYSKNPNDCFSIPAIPITPLETTGAGDAFDAGYISALVRGLPIQDCAKYGVICGGLSTTAKGGIAALPKYEEVKQWL